MGNYYYLVAGLPDIAFDGGRPQFSIERFREEVEPYLSASDAKCINLFFLSVDNANILALLRRGEDAAIDKYGCYSRRELQEIIESVSAGDVYRKDVPSYIYSFLERYMATEAAENVIWEDVIGAYYYEYAMKSPNSFVASWFEYNLNVNNILIALSARKYKLAIAETVVGDGEVATALRTSGARDFGLAGVVDYIEDLQRLSENGNLLERERQLDTMRWAWLDDNSVSKHFSVERLFVFLVKLGITERWASLDADKGMETYKALIEELKSGMENHKVEV